MSELLTSSKELTSRTAGPVCSAGPAAARSRVPLLVKAMAALVVVYLTLLAVPGAGPVGGVMTNASFLLFPGLAALSCLQAASRAEASHRRTWRLMALALATYAAGGVVWLSYGLQGVPVPVPSVAEVGFLGWVLPLAAALLALPVAHARRLVRAEILLDCAVLCTSVLFVVWTTVLVPLQATAVGLQPAEMAALYAYPLVDVFVIAAALATLMRVRSRDLRSWLLLVVGLLVVAAGDLLYVALLVRDAYDPAAPYNGLWAVAFLLVALSPHVGGLALPAGQRLTVGRALVPYSALAVAGVVALVTPVRPDENLGIFALAVVVLLLASARQVLVVVVKTRLADDLEAEVAAVTSGLRAEQEFLAAVVDSLHAGVVACDRHGRVTLFNAATAQLHSDPDMLRAEQWESDLRTSDGARPLITTPLMRALAGDRVEDVEFMIVPPDAPALALTASGRALRGPDGEVVGAVVAMHDVTERRRQQQALERKALRDDLTGLGNRLAFTTALSAQLQGGAPATILLLDLDDFKNINDSLGHDAGDQCLVDLSRRLTGVLGQDGTAYRLGGDEFVIVLTAEVRDPMTCAEGVLDAVAEPTRLAGTELLTTASIGMATSAGHCSTPRELLQAADLAMYVVKSGGKSGVFVYEDHMRGEAQQRLALEADLRRAVADGGLHLQYQPIVDLISGRMTSAEALVRWTDPDRGPVSPVDFIPVAEQCGLILPLGEWVLQEACAQLLQWDALGGDGAFRVTVNISTRQLERPGLLEVLDRCLQAGVHPTRLVLEVTETALTVDSAAAVRTMHEIRARGVQLAVDDFGTGYSSLSRLRSAPVSRIKIDRSFVAEIGVDYADVPIIEATVAIARGLGMGVIAEGIETAEQLHYLQRLGCPEAQGYLLSRPLDPDALLACMQTPPWAALLPGTPERPALAAGAGEFQQLVTRATDQDVDLEELVRPLLAQMQTTSGLATTYLTRVDTDTDRQEVFFVHSDVPGGVTEGLVVPWSASLCKRALDDGPRRSSDAARDYPGTAVVQELGLSSFIVEPVLDADGRLYGTLCGTSTGPHAFAESDNANVRMYARLIEQKLKGSAKPPVVEAPPTSTLPARRRRAEQLWEAVREQLLSSCEDVALLASRAQQIEVVDAAWAAQKALVCEAAPQATGSQRVVVADDQQLLRELLGALIEAEEHMTLTGTSDSAWSCVGVVAAEQPDILVLDYDLGDAPASDVIEHLRLLSPATRVLLHSARSDVHQLGQQMRVDRTVHKGDDADHLSEALSMLAM